MWNEHEGDMDEGDVPYAGQFCSCGLTYPGAKPEVESCPDCSAPWPASLKTRWPYDGGPEVRSLPGSMHVPFASKAAPVIALASELAMLEKAMVDEGSRALKPRMAYPRIVCEWAWGRMNEIPTSFRAVEHAPGEVKVEYAVVDSMGGPSWRSLSEQDVPDVKARSRLRGSALYGLVRELALAEPEASKSRGSL